MMSSRQLVVAADPDLYGIILPKDKMRGRWVLFGLDVWSAVILLTIILGWAGGRENRVALVIGNAAYQSVGELPTPVNDALAIAELLRGAGFSAVELRQNIGNSDLQRVLRDFAEAVRHADIAVVYYSGHGIEFNGENYLIPVDAKLERDVEGLDLENQAVSLRRVLASLQPAKRLGLVMLDASRELGLLNLPATTTPRPIGFAQSDIGPTNANTLIAFANAPGSTRANAEPERGLFTTALLNHLATPGLDVREALGLAGQEVLARTDHKQEPLIFGSLGSETISLVPAATSGVSSNAKPPGTRRLTLDARADHETAHNMERTLTSHYSGFQTELARAAQAKLQAADTAHLHKAENPDAEGAPQPQPEVVATTENPRATKVAQSYVANPALVEAFAPVTAPGELTNRSSTAIVFAGDVLTPNAPPNRSLQASTTDSGELARLLQLQLHRVGCDPIKINGDWNSQSRRALEAFNRHAGTKLDLRVASLEALDAVKSRTSRICPLICEHGYRARGNSCVEVEKTESKPAPPRVHRQHVAHRPPPSVAPAPVRRAPPIPEPTPPAPDANASTGKNCHTLASHVFCD